jgi:hypothetical protein
MVGAGCRRYKAQRKLSNLSVSAADVSANALACAVAVAIFFARNTNVVNKCRGSLDLVPILRRSQFYVTSYTKVSLCLPVIVLAAESHNEHTAEEGNEERVRDKETLA